MMGCKFRALLGLVMGWEYGIKDLGPDYGPGRAGECEMYV